MWLIVFIVLLLLSFWGYVVVKNALKPDTKITQSKRVDSTITYEKKLKHYDFPDFGIDIPANWLPVPRAEGPYQTYTWQTSEHGTNGQQIQIFEDTIPPNFAVNRALIVVGEGDHISLNGEASDGCTQYTKGSSSVPGQPAVTAKWQGIDFLCDTGNTQRTLVGTSSTDGVNTVILRSPFSGKQHKFLFAYTAQDLNPDFSVFYNSLATFKMQ